MTIIITLIVIAVLLALGELVVPGGILGILSFLCLCAAAYFTNQEYGMMIAIAVFFGSTVLTVVSLFMFFGVLKKMGFTKGVFLNTSVEGKSAGANADRASDDLIGKEGEALTPLVPTGMIGVDGSQYEAFCQTGYLDKGNSVQIIGRDNFRLIVKAMP